jgi:creatinine amidohydrolase/Fe(II)-dependent formamide hydrolase-like protein
MITFRDPSDLFTANPPQVAILPLACQETRGEFILDDFGQMILTGISQRVAGQLPYQTFLVPVWPYGTDSGPGQPSVKITLRPETLWSVVHDMVQSLYDHEIRQVAVINSHGSCNELSALPFGNSVVKTAVRQLNYEIPGLTVIWVQPFKVARKRLMDLLGEGITTELVEKLIAGYLAPDLAGSHTTGNEPVILRSEVDHPGKLAFEAACLATSEYIQNTLTSLAGIKSRK